MNGKYVFISYSSEDTEQANWVKSTLESNGIPCWIANKSIHGGKNFSNEIPNAINGCSAFVIVLTKNSQESEWVQDEILEAREAKKRILPFVLDDTPLNKSFGFIFKTIQMYNAITDPEKEIENLIRDIQEEFNVPTAKVKVKNKAPKNKSNKKKMKVLKILLIALIVISVLSGGIGLLSGSLLLNNTNDTLLPESDTDTTKSSENIVQNWLDNKEEETTVPLLNLFDNLTFELDGVTYSLPCNFSELYANGWEPQTYNSINEMVYVHSNTTLIKNDSCIYITAYASEPCELINSKVGRISYEPDCNVSFSVNEKIKPGAHYDELVAEFGTPDKLSRDDIDLGLDYDTFGYVYDFERRIEFTFYKDTSRCYKIELKNYIYEKEY
ncbi:MAG: toll/interleukin-1 receptor domain-containing protein [Ruminococcaceae bacterium]|nr:toll/interleukin-1 receptor domain-containing protein [Oscillospiraceae bacterium]